ncbi:MAG: hypothetical protein AAGC60_18625 [Acidobacteriota bacterium]
MSLDELAGFFAGAGAERILEKAVGYGARGPIAVHDLFVDEEYSIDVSLLFGTGAWLVRFRFGSVVQGQLEEPLFLAFWQRAGPDPFDAGDDIDLGDGIDAERPVEGLEPDHLPARSLRDDGREERLALGKSRRGEQERNEPKNGQDSPSDPALGNCPVELWQVSSGPRDEASELEGRHSDSP